MTPVNHSGLAIRAEEGFCHRFFWLQRRRERRGWM